MFRKILCVTLTSIYANFAIANMAMSQDDLDCKQALINSGLHVVDGGQNWILRYSADIDLQASLSPETLSVLNAFRNLLEERGALLAIVSVPPRGYFADEPAQEYIRSKSWDQQLDSSIRKYIEEIESLNKIGIIAPNLLDMSSISGLQKSDMMMPRDHHWTVAGADAVATYIRDATSTSALGRQESSNFTKSEDVESTSILANLENKISEACGEPEVSTEIIYNPVIREDDNEISDKLFGDTPSSQVVALVGTSFSNGKNIDVFRWEDSIRFRLQSETSMHAYAGANQSVLEPYIRNFLDQEAPWLIVWETANNFPQESAIREAITPLLSSCDGSAVVRKTILNVPNDVWTEVHDYIVLQDVWSFNMAQEFTGELALKATYTDGSEAVFNFQNDDRIPKDLRSDTKSMYVADTRQDYPLGNPVSIAVQVTEADSAQTIEAIGCSSKF